MTELCLTLIFPRALGDTVVDALLALPAMGSFTSTPAAMHGWPEQRLTAREQVLGQAAMMRIDAIVAAAGHDALLTTLRAALAGAGVRFWITPLLAAGEFA